MLSTVLFFVFVLFYLLSLDVCTECDLYEVVASTPSTPCESQEVMTPPLEETSYHQSLIMWLHTRVPLLCQCFLTSTNISRKGSGFLRRASKFLIQSGLHGWHLVNS